MSTIAQEILFRTGPAVIVPLENIPSCDYVNGYKSLTISDMNNYYFQSLEDYNSFGIAVGKPSNGLVALHFNTIESLLQFRDLNRSLEGSLVTFPNNGAKLWFVVEGHYPCSGIILDNRGRDWARLHSEGEIVPIEISNAKEDWSLFDVNNRLPAKVRFNDIRWFSNLTLPWIEAALFAEFYSRDSQEPGATSHIWREGFENGSYTYNLIQDERSDTLKQVKEDDMRYKYRMEIWIEKVDQYIFRKIESLKLDTTQKILEQAIYPIVSECDPEPEWLKRLIKTHCPALSQEEADAIVTEFYPTDHVDDPAENSEIRDATVAEILADL